VVRTATTTLVPAVMQKAAAQAPPPRPIRSRPTKVRMAPAGWPAVWVAQWSGECSRMWSVKPRRVGPRCWKRGTVLTYSCGVLSRPAMPRCQPSISASDQVQAMAAAHADPSRVRHDSRAASAGP
jgi:hypothetical protein